MNHVHTAGQLRLPPGIEPGGRFRGWEPRRVDYVVCDVDGTLIGPSALASQEVVDAVARARSAGMRVGYATGRMRDAVARLHDQLDAAGPHILHNGAEVRADGRTVVAWSLTPAEVDALLAVATGHPDLYLEVYAESGFHASAWDERARRHWELLGAEPLSVITSASDLPTTVIPKATFAVFADAALTWLLAQLAELPVETGHAGSPQAPGMTFVNVVRPGVSKGVALQRAAGHLGVDLGHVAAIGDASNDLSMLAVAGTAIAMRQAAAEVREASHLVVPGVDDHGVAAALDSLVGWSRPA